MKKNGFTMVEIIIVMFILLLLAAIAFPSFIKVRAEALAKKAKLESRSRNGGYVGEGRALFTVGNFVTSKLTNFRGQVIEAYAPIGTEANWQYDVRFVGNGTNIFMMTMKEFELLPAME